MLLLTGVDGLKPGVMALKLSSVNRGWLMLVGDDEPVRCCCCCCCRPWSLWRAFSLSRMVLLLLVELCWLRVAADAAWMDGAVSWPCRCLEAGLDLGGVGQGSCRAGQHAVAAEPTVDSFSCHDKHHLGTRVMRSPEVVLSSVYC
jgi:hypothetical protein